MANCNSYQKLTTKEKVVLIGELVHAVQNDETCFITAKGMISAARQRKVFENIKVGIESITSTNN
jgi:uncharacterized protein YdeI (BOF family)